jgi:hypothetical protein
VRWLRFIRRRRDLGITLAQVRDLLRLSSEKGRTCQDRITKPHLSAIEEKIADLTRLAAELRHISKCCNGDGLIADCRIIEALSPEGNVRTSLGDGMQTDKLSSCSKCVRPVA